MRLEHAPQTVGSDVGGCGEISLPDDTNTKLEAPRACLLDLLAATAIRTYDTAAATAVVAAAQWVEKSDATDRAVCDFFVGLPGIHTEHWEGKDIWP